MKLNNTVNLPTLLAWFPVTAVAEEATLPAPVLEWSFYVLLLFALFVGIGIFFFRKPRDEKQEPVRSLIAGRQSTVHAVEPDTSVTECVRQMNAEQIGAMLVMENDRLLGIFTERDAMTRVLGAGLEPTCTKISAVMSRDPICISPTTTLEDAMAIVSKQRVRHLPVVENGKVLGMVSSGDLTHWLVQDKSGEIRELVDVAGRGGGSP